MKKLFITATVFGILALASCKKDWNCDCTGDIMGTPVTATVETYKDIKKGEAKDKCNKFYKDIDGDEDDSFSCEISKK